MSVDALLKLREDINRALERKANELRSQLSMLGHAPTGSIKGNKVPPKYRSPSGETWAGRGARPRWLVAAIKREKKVEDFLIAKQRSRKVGLNHSMDAKHVTQIALLLTGMIADGFFYSAHAECADTDKIYIDPKLVPKPLPMSRESLMAVLANPSLPPETKDFFLKQAMQGRQPIAVPFGTGKVLVHPTNPCIQQYIPGDHDDYPDE